VGLNTESWSHIESIYSGGVLGLLFETQNEAWDFFEKLAWEIYAFEQANESFKYPTHGEYDFHVNSYPLDHFVNSYGLSYSYMPSALCDYCEYSNHDAHTCPFRTDVDATCASFEKNINELTYQMIETMKVRIAACSSCLTKIRRLIVRLILL